MIRDRDLLERGAERGVELCRGGDWKKGLSLLAKVVTATEELGAGAPELPGSVYSYTGYGIAKFDKKYREGLDLCRHSIEVEFYEPDNFANLARVCLLIDRRKEAVRALRHGLKIHPDHLLLRGLYRDMGVRREPVLSFLSRANLLNRLLGRLRWGRPLRLDIPIP